MSLGSLLSFARRVDHNASLSRPAAKTRLRLETLEDRAVPAAFTPGNLAIYRVGSGTGTLVNTGSAVFVDEYTPAGALVQSVALPTTVSGSNKQLIASGTATSEGLLTLSADGQYLVLTGYASDLGGTNVLPNVQSTVVGRTVGRIDVNGNIDTSTVLTDLATTGTSGLNPRAATSTNGTDLWVTSGIGGVHYAPLGSTTSTIVASTPGNLRGANIFDGQLYVTTASGTAVRLGAVGTGTPTTTGQTITNIPGFATATGSPYGFFYADLDAGVAGVDTLYVADDGAAALTKYSLVAGTWTSNGFIGVDTDDYRGVTGYVSGTTVTLYATRKGGSAATGGGEYVSLVDSSGYNGAFAGTPTLLATAATNTAFRGIAPVPVGGNDTTGPTITSVETIAPNPRNTAVSTIDVTFSEAINLATFTAADIGLTRNASPVTLSGNETFTLVSGTTYQVGGLAEETGLEGAYVFSVDPTGIQDVVGNNGTGAASTTSWNVDTTGPTVVSVETILPNPRSTPVATIDVTFDQPIDLATFTAADIGLTLNAAPVTLSGNETFTLVSGNIYRVSGLTEETGADGNYVFTVTATGINDALGNAGTGSGNTAWTKTTADTVAPTVTGLFLDGTAWTTAFRTAAGNATFGYPAQTGAGQLTTVPWSTVNRFIVTFSEPVTALTVGQVGVRGVNVATYTVSSITTINTSTYQINLSGAVDTDWLILDVDASATGVKDIAGNALAGTFTENVSTFPTTGPAGVNFKYRFKITVGDADRNNIVRNADKNLVTANLFVDAGTAGYNIYADTNADGIVRNADKNIVNAHLFVDGPTGGGPSRPRGNAVGGNGQANAGRSGRFDSTAIGAARSTTGARRIGTTLAANAIDELFAQV